MIHWDAIILLIITVYHHHHNHNMVVVLVVKFGERGREIERWKHKQWTLVTWSNMIKIWGHRHSSVHVGSCRRKLLLFSLFLLIFLCTFQVPAFLHDIDLCVYCIYFPRRMAFETAFLITCCYGLAGWDHNNNNNKCIYT